MICIAYSPVLTHQDPSGPLLTLRFRFVDPSGLVFTLPTGRLVLGWAMKSLVFTLPTGSLVLGWAMKSLFFTLPTGSLLLGWAPPLPTGSLVLGWAPPLPTGRLVLGMAIKSSSLQSLSAELVHNFDLWKVLSGADRLGGCVTDSELSTLCGGRAVVP